MLGATVGIDTAGTKQLHESISLALSLGVSFPHLVGGSCDGSLC